MQKCFSISAVVTDAEGMQAIGKGHDSQISHRTVPKYGGVKI